MNQSKHKELREKALKEIAKIQNLPHTPEGEALLVELKRMFYGPPLYDQYPHTTHIRAGELNVIRHIEEILSINISEVKPDVG